MLRSPIVTHWLEHFDLLTSFYVTTFKVAGNGKFPTDMLSHDACFPKSGVDPKSIGCTEYRSIEMEHYHNKASWMPDVDRWKAYGWSVDQLGIVTRRIG